MSGKRSKGEARMGREEGSGTEEKVKAMNGDLRVEEARKGEM